MSKGIKHKLVLAIISIFIFAAIILTINWSSIFQKGNPIPYLKSMFQLNEKQTFIQVKKENPIIFLTERDHYEDLHKYIENTYDVSFDDQMGSGYIFSSEEKEIILTSEIYWKYFKVWTMRIT